MDLSIWLIGLTIYLNAIHLYPSKLFEVALIIGLDKIQDNFKHLGGFVPIPNVMSMVKT